MYDVFCAVMGNKDNEDFIVELLNSILSESITEPIKHIENIDTRGEKSSTYSGLTFYDFRCVTDSNKKIIVEMQCYNDEYLMERMLIYLAKTFVSQLNNKNNRNSHNNKDNEQNKKQNNKRYKDCNQVYEILILTEYTYKQIEEYFEHAVLTGKRTKKEITDLINLILIQLPRFNKTLEECKNNKLDTAILFLKEGFNMNTLQLNNAKKTSTLFKKGSKALGWFALPEQRQAAAINNKMRIEGIKAAQEREKREAVEAARSEGRAEGRVKGRAEGRVEGERIGEERGKVEGIREATIALAKSLKEQGVSIEIIMSCTKLSEDEIERL